MVRLSVKPGKKTLDQTHTVDVCSVLSNILALGKSALNNMNNTISERKKCVRVKER